MPAVPSEICLQIAGHLDPISHLAFLHECGIHPTENIARTLTRYATYTHEHGEKCNHMHALETIAIEELPGYKALAACMEVARAQQMIQQMYAHVPFPSILTTYIHLPFQRYDQAYFLWLKSAIHNSNRHRPSPLSNDCFKRLDTLLTQCRRDCDTTCQTYRSFIVSLPIAIPRSVSTSPSFWELAVRHCDWYEVGRVFSENDGNVVLHHLLTRDISVEWVLSHYIVRQVTRFDPDLLSLLELNVLLQLHEEMWSGSRDASWACRAEIKRRFPHEFEQCVQPVLPCSIPSRMLRRFKPEPSSLNEQYVRFSTRLCQDSLFASLPAQSQVDMLMFADASCKTIQSIKSQFFNDMIDSIDTDHVVKLCLVMNDVEVLKIISQRYSLKITENHDTYFITPAVAHFLINVGAYTPTFRLREPTSAHQGGALTLIYYLTRGNVSPHSLIDSVTQWGYHLHPSLTLEMLRSTMTYLPSDLLNHLAFTYMQHFNHVGFVEFTTTEFIDGLSDTTRHSLRVLRALRRWEFNLSPPGLESLSPAFQTTLRDSQYFHQHLSYVGWTPFELRSIMKWMHPTPKNPSNTVTPTGSSIETLRVPMEYWFSGGG